MTEEPRPTVSWPGPDGNAPPTDASAKPQPHGFSIAMVVLGVVLFAFSDVVAKQLSASLPAEQVVWLRFVPLIGIALFLVMRRRRPLRARRPGLQILRGIALLGAGEFFNMGLHYLGLAEATAISFVTPAFITLLAIPWLGEKVGVHRWTALTMGLVGVLVVVRPGTGAFQLAALLPAASAFCGAVMAVVTRQIGHDDSSETTILWSTLTGFGLLSVSAPLWWTAFDLQLLGWALVMGTLYGMGQYLLVLAYSRGDASLVAPFSYAQVVAATILSALIFSHLPDWISLGGIALIVASGAYTLYREGVLSGFRLRKR